MRWEKPKAMPPPPCCDDEEVAVADTDASHCPTCGLPVTVTTVSEDTVKATARRTAAVCVVRMSGDIVAF
jgi:hypothetical protein